MSDDFTAPCSTKISPKCRGSPATCCSTARCTSEADTEPCSIRMLPMLAVGISAAPEEADGADGASDSGGADGATTCACVVGGCGAVAGCAASGGGAAAGIFVATAGAGAAAL